MVKYEYDIAVTSTETPGNAIVEYLNELGEKGWKVFNVVENRETKRAMIWLIREKSPIITAH